LFVGFTTAAAMVHEFEARDEKRLLRLQRQLAAHKLLITDELGYVCRGGDTRAPPSWAGSNNISARVDANATSPAWLHQITSRMPKGSGGKPEATPR